MINALNLLTALCLPCPSSNSDREERQHGQRSEPPLLPTCNTNEELCADWTAWRLALTPPQPAAPRPLSKRQTEQLHKRIDAELERLAHGDAHDHDTRSSVMLSLCRSQTLQGIFLRTCWLHSDDTRELRAYIKSSWQRRSINSWRKAKDPHTAHLEELNGAITGYEDFNISCAHGNAEELGLPANPAEVISWCETDYGLRYEADFNPDMIDFLLNDCVVQERQIFLLKEVYGVRSRDIAELLKDEISEDYINTKHSRLKKRMKQRLLALGCHGHQRAA